MDLIWWHSRPIATSLMTPSGNPASSFADNFCLMVFQTVSFSIAAAKS
jgi:hypothetical protein